MDEDFRKELERVKVDKHKDIQPRPTENKEPVFDVVPEPEPEALGEEGMEDADDDSTDIDEPEYEEKKHIDWTRGLLYICVTAMLAIIIFYQMMTEVTPGIAVVMMLFGMMCFLPAGMLLGKLFLDPYIRCKIMRRMRGKNYAMVKFVHKGGQRSDIRIKDLDDDVIVQGTKVWVLNKGSIYHLNQEGYKVLDKSISTKNMLTNPSQVPEVYVDAESMYPLTFHSNKSQCNPQEVGAVLLGYVHNQIAKNMFFKKTQGMFNVIMLALCCINTMIGLMIFDMLGGFGT